MTLGDAYFQWAARLFDAARIPEKPEALRGTRVLDLSQGHYGALLTGTYLAELGAFSSDAGLENDPDAVASQMALPTRRLR